MARQDRVQRLVDQALDEFDDASNSVTKTLRRCLRIANLRNDYRNLFWLQLESLNIATEKTEVREGTLTLQAHFEQEEWQDISQPEFATYLDRRRQGKGDNIEPRSVAELENVLEAFRTGIDQMSVPDGLHPVDLYIRSDEVSKAQLQLTTSQMPIREALTKIQRRLHVYLLEAESQLEYGQINSDIFERTRRSVDEQLALVAPEALASFNAAYKRTFEGDPEALSHALTSCRRVLKSVADAVYPATKQKVVGADGKERALTDDKYLNRLLQAVSEALGKHGQGEVLTAVITDLAKRLESLNSLASKGVHDTVTADEVDTCVIQTYLLVGDVLKVTAGKSALADAVSGREAGFLAKLGV